MRARMAEVSCSAGGRASELRSGTCRTSAQYRVRLAYVARNGASRARTAILWVMTTELIVANEADRVVVRRLLELNAHDFSEIDGRDVGPHGEYGYRYLDHYWTVP